MGVVLLVLQQHNLYSTRLVFPFFKTLIPDLGWAYLLFTVLVLVGSSNAVNLTDGLDGLAISTFAIAAAATPRWPTSSATGCWPTTCCSCTSRRWRS